MVKFASRDDRVEQANYGANETTGRRRAAGHYSNARWRYQYQLRHFATMSQFPVASPGLARAEPPGKVREKL